MAEVIYAQQALADLERLVDFLAETDAHAALHTIYLIEEALGILVRHPQMGRPVEHGLRELVISRGRSGYVALYAYEQAHEACLVLAVRHQREAGYLDGQP